MKPTICMFTGIPGSGKSTGIEAAKTIFQDCGISAGVVDEFFYVKQWARDLGNIKYINQLPNDNWDIKPEGYVCMNKQVAPRVGIEAFRLLENGINMVLFESARGVGEPMVTYSDFLRLVCGELGDLSQFNIINFEVLSGIDLVRRRLVDRYEVSNGTLPPPEILDKYLNKDDTPRCFAVRDLRINAKDLPIIWSESIDNRSSKPTLEGGLRVVVPKIIELLGSEERSEINKYIDIERNRGIEKF